MWRKAGLPARSCRPTFRPCDAENRLFVNPAECIPKGVTSLCFERGAGLPPPSPVPVSTVEGHVYYYRYRPGGTWESWEPAELLARWRRVPRLLPDDGSCRPVWLAMKTAAAAGRIETFDAAVQDGTPFGLRIAVHATSQGPRSATAVSENVIDGTVAAFHARARNPALIASALAPRMPVISQAELEELVAADPPRPLSSASDSATPWPVSWAIILTASKHSAATSPALSRCSETTTLPSETLVSGSLS